MVLTVRYRAMFALSLPWRAQEADEFFAAVWPDLPAHHRAEVAAWLQTSLAARGEAVRRALTCFAQAGALEAAATHRWDRLANATTVLELVLHWGAMALDDKVGSGAWDPRGHHRRTWQC